MKKEILIVVGVYAREKNEPTSAAFASGLTNLMTADANVTVTYIDNIQIVIDNDSFELYDAATGRPFSDFDLITMHGRLRTHREIAYAVSRYCQYRDIPHFNDYSVYYPGSKVGQAVAFLEAGVRIPKTLYALDGDRLLALAEKELEAPFILKHINGTKGKSNYLVQNIKEARERLAAEPDVPFMAQAYCPNDRDYRVLVTPTRELVFERRGGADTHLNNTSQGAAAALAPAAVPPQVIAQARAVAKALGLTLGGVDVMRHLDTGEFYFIEINSQPQLFTGALLDEKNVFAHQLILDLLA